MTDYGQELLFGAFVTPSSRDAEAVVALAQLAEQAGLDLVTFQDHPYQPAFLDTWTLLSYVAARTAGYPLVVSAVVAPVWSLTRTGLAIRTLRARRPGRTPDTRIWAASPLDLAR